MKRNAWSPNSLFLKRLAETAGFIWMPVAIYTTAVVAVVTGAVERREPFDPIF